MHPIKRAALGYAPGFIRRRAMKKYQGQLKQILVLRKDLKMRRGKEVSQGAHASMAGFLRFRNDPFMKTWLEQAFTKITVTVDSEEEFFEILEKAKRAGIAHALITDAGRTEFNGVPTNTAISVGPCEPEFLQDLTGHLKLR